MNHPTTPRQRAQMPQAAAEGRGRKSIALFKPGAIAQELPKVPLFAPIGPDGFELASGLGKPRFDFISQGVANFLKWWVGGDSNPGPMP